MSNDQSLNCLSLNAADHAVEYFLSRDPAFVLECLDPHTRTSKTTYLGFGGEVSEIARLDPTAAVEAIRSAVSDAPLPSPEAGVAPGAGGGVLALVGFEALARHGGERRAGSALPDGIIVRPAVLVTIDHLNKQLWIARLREGGGSFDATIEHDIASFVAEPALGPADKRHGDWTPLQTEDEFCEMTRACQAEMDPDGPLNGAVLSVQMRAPGSTDALAAYRKLRSINPSTYMFLVRAPSIDLWGATSLALVSVRDGMLYAETDGATYAVPSDDFVWTPSAKEIVEYDVVLNALVDDLDPLLETGSAERVSEMEERRFFGLAHLFAAIRGRLRAGVDGIDAFAGLSPHGAAVGYTRAAAEAQIAQREVVERGPYTGSIGFFAFDGVVESACVSRSMWQADGFLHVHGGAKVVPASDPAGEYQECVMKTLALRNCVESNS